MRGLPLEKMNDAPMQRGARTPEKQAWAGMRAILLEKMNDAPMERWARASEKQAPTGNVSPSIWWGSALQELEVPVVMKNTFLHFLDADELEGKEIATGLRRSQSWGSFSSRSLDSSGFEMPCPSSWRESQTSSPCNTSSRDSSPLPRAEVDQDRAPPLAPKIINVPPLAQQLRNGTLPEQREALDESQLADLIPRDANGTIASVGSSRHDEGLCTPCLFWLQDSCVKGERCTFCHVPHEDQRRKRLRPSKKTRKKWEKQGFSVRDVINATKMPSADTEAGLVTSSLKAAVDKLSAQRAAAAAAADAMQGDALAAQQGPPAMAMYKDALAAQPGPAPMAMYKDALAAQQGPAPMAMYKDALAAQRGPAAMAMHKDTLAAQQGPAAMAMHKDAHPAQRRPAAMAMYTDQSLSPVPAPVGYQGNRQAMQAWQ